MKDFPKSAFFKNKNSKGKYKKRFKKILKIHLDVDMGTICLIPNLILDRFRNIFNKINILKLRE